MKKTIAILIALMLVLSVLPMAAFAAEEETEMIPVMVYVPEDWGTPNLWAWADDGTNAFASWPGEAMEELAEGWYYIYATTFMTGEDKYTLAAGLNALQATEMTGSWPVFTAASITVSMPVRIIFFMCQKYMTSGLTAGGVKG